MNEFRLFHQKKKGETCLDQILNDEGKCCKTFTVVIFKPLQPSLMFVDMARGLP
jgi:hypothetical protein